MAKTNWQDPGSTEIRSTHITGLQAAAGRVEDSLDLQTAAVSGASLSEVYISGDDRYRIYQVDNQIYRNWVADPAPVIKVNGSQVLSAFEIDYAGGAVIFSPGLSPGDTVTADFSHITNQTVVSDTAAPSGDTGTVKGILGWLAYMIKSITGKAGWRTPPATTLEAAKAHMDAPSPHTDHVRGSARLTVDSSAPSSPDDGDIWIDNSDSQLFMKCWSASSSAWTDLISQIELVNYQNRQVLASESATVNIGIPQYVKGIDVLFVFQNSVFIHEGTDYTVSIDSARIDNVNGNWTAGTEFVFIVLKSRVRASGEDYLDGSQLIDASIPIAKFTPDIQGKLASNDFLSLVQKSYSTVSLAYAYITQNAQRLLDTVIISGDIVGTIDYTYNAINNNLEQEVVSITSPYTKTITTTYEYNVDGDLISEQRVIS